RGRKASRHAERAGFSRPRLRDTLSVACTPAYLRNRITKPIATLGSGSATWGQTPPGGARPQERGPQGRGGLRRGRHGWGDRGSSLGRPKLGNTPGVT